MTLEVMLSMLCPAVVVNSRPGAAVLRPNGAQLVTMRAENVMALRGLDKVPAETTSCTDVAVQVRLAHAVASAQATVGNNFKPPPTAINPLHSPNAKSLHCPTQHSQTLTLEEL